MKDDALRMAILLASQSYATRKDHDGDLISNALQIILRTAERFDEVMEIGIDEDSDAAPSTEAT